ncbi:MAG: MFS transporter [Gammaproteobacteria bacterium]
MTPRRLRGMLAALCLATFLASASGIVLSPYLRAIAQDFATDLAASANLLTYVAIAWGITAMVAGAISDRLGRRALLIIGILVMAVASVGFALAHEYLTAALWRGLTGVGGGIFMGTVFAAVADHIPSEARGRALGWVITGQSLALVLGVPLFTWLGAFGGWRGAMIAHGALGLVTALGIAVLVPADPAKHSATGARRAPLRVIWKAPLLTLLGASITERLCFATAAVYLATFLQESYGVSLAALAIGLGFVALGNLAGNVLGGFIADRFRARPLVFATSSAVTAVLALPLLLWNGGLALSLILGFAYSLANSLGRPALMATLSEVPREVRGTVLGLNSTMASIGWIGASALGGWLLTRFGFASLGVFCALASGLGTLLALAHWRLRRVAAPAHQL